MIVVNRASRKLALSVRLLNTSGATDETLGKSPCGCITGYPCFGLAAVEPAGRGAICRQTSQLYPVRVDLWERISFHKPLWIGSRIRSVSALHRPQSWPELTYGDRPRNPFHIAVT